MSPLARKVAWAALAILGLQFAGALGIQYALGRTLRVEVVLQIAQGLEDTGGLKSCTERPGPWQSDQGWFALWPIAVDGTVVGEGVAVERVTLPPPGRLAPWSDGEREGAVYGSASRECGGLLMLPQKPYPIFEAQSGRIAGLAGLRVLLVLVSALALVAVTALPLVRRIRRLSRAMTEVVAADFEGAVADGAPEDELGEVARAFDQAAASARERLARLEHRDAVLRRALADFTHDLRTPLATLKLSASGLPASTAASTMRSEFSFLEGMTDNFEAILAGADEGDVSKVSLVELVKRVEHRFTPLAKDRGLTFEVALPDGAPAVLADGVTLERAVGNLVHNAIRFAGGHVVLLLFRDGDEVRLEVRDDGPGLGAVSGRAAERGRRGEHAAGEGFGLGLAIAEACARRFGGRLELEDVDEGGALAAIVLPHAAVVRVSQGAGSRVQGVTRRRPHESRHRSEDETS